MKRLTAIVGVVLMFALGLAPVTAQEDQTEEDTPEANEPVASESGDGGSIGFGLGLAFGVASFEDPKTGDQETFQALALQPDLSIGKFGLGLDLRINYRLNGGRNRDEFEIREEDWEVGDFEEFLEVYLPKFRYVRYGVKGDPIYAQFGGFSNATLGTGFLVNNYSNELFVPDLRIFGGILDFDGEVVGFPYLGIESVVGNVAVLDVMGARVYTRPLADLEVPLLPALQIGATFVTDQDPFYHLKRDPDSPFSNDFDGTRIDAPDDEITMWGIDLIQPILRRDLITMNAFTDLSFQEDRRGGMVGAGGRIASLVLYGAQIRAVEDNFIPSFFDGTYDLRRGERYFTYNEDPEFEVDGYIGWLARLGVALFDDGLVFDNTVSGPFVYTQGAYPELTSRLLIGEGIVPGLSGLSFEASYQKFNLRKYEDLWDIEDAIIGARINVRSGPVVISLLFDVTYDPLADGDPWVITSGLESAIALQ